MIALRRISVSPGQVAAIGALIVLPPASVLLLGPAKVLTVFLAVAVALGILVSPKVRLSSILLGAILTFQSESALLKVGFLFLCVIALGFALKDLVGAEHAPLFATWQPLLIACLFFLGYIVLTGPLALTRGASPIDWARDASALIFAATLPVVGMASGLKIERQFILKLFIAIGCVSTASFVVQWLTNREVTAVGRITYGDNYLTASLFCLCLATAAGGQRRWLGKLAAATVFGTVLLTGNRSLLVLAAGFVGVVGSESRLRLSGREAIKALLLLIAGLYVIAQLAFHYIPGERELLTQRVEVTRSYLDTGDDQSAISRTRQKNLATEQFWKYPALGTAPGHKYLDPFYIPGVSDPRRNRGAFFNLDTPVVLFAKFGLIGVCVILFWLGTLVRCCLRSLRAQPPTPLANALRAFVLIGIAFLPFGITLEQKGFAITIMMFIALLASGEAKSTDGIDGVRSAAPAPVAG